MGDTVRLHPSDDPSQYKTRCRKGKIELAKTKEGNCVYLGPTGCNIHQRSPYACQRFDCREYALLVEGMSPEMRDARINHPAVQEGLRRLGR